MEESPMEATDTAVEQMEEILYDTKPKLETMDNTDSEIQHIVDAAYTSDVTFGPGFQQETNPIQQAPVTSPPAQPKSILKNKSGQPPWKKKPTENKEKVDLACDICDLKFTSWVIANDHLNGKKHAKRLRLAQTNKAAAQTPAMNKPAPVQPVVVKTEIPENKIDVPSRTQYRLERLSSFKERTVIVWPINQQDLSNPKLLEVVENCCHWFCRFYSRDRVDNKSLGNLEIRFKTVADAEEGAIKLSSLRDETKVEGETGTSPAAVIIQKLKATDTVDKAIIALKGSYPKGSFEYRTVFVGSLPPTMTEEKLKGYFPTSTSVLIPRDENNLQKGYAYIEYDTTEQATAVTNNMTSLVIDGETVSVVNFFMANEKTGNKPVKRPLSPRAPGQAAQAVSPAQPAAKKPATAVGDSKQALPAGAMSNVKRQILMAKLKSLKKNMRKNQEVKNNPELRKMLRNWHSAVQRDTETRKKFHLPCPGPLPEDPDKEFGPIRAKSNWRTQGGQDPPAKRMKRGGGAGGAGWQQRGGGRFENRNWQNTAPSSSAPDYNSNQTANAVNLLMGLTQALSGQSNFSGGGGGRGRGSTGYQGKKGGGRGGGSLSGGGGLGASAGYQGKQQRMLPNLKSKGNKSPQGGSGGRYQDNPTHLMSSQSGQDGYGAAAMQGDGYGNMGSMGTGQQDYSDGGYSGGYSGGGYTDTSYTNDYSMDTSNNSYQDNWNTQYNSGGMNTDTSQQTNRNNRGSLGRGQSWW